MTSYALFAAVFLACLVEAVEATTIVVAAGASRNWRSALTGTVAAVVVLAVIVAAAGPAIMMLPLAVLRVVIGGLLLVFGLQWLRKAVLRAAGVKALHDEDAIYRREVAAASAAASTRRAGVSDWYAFTLSFKGVLLEGLEVVFIVLTFATNQGNLPVAVVAAAAAVLVVVTMGVIVRGPLARVPENALKFVVGVMLTSFGLFWGAQGVGADWPGSDGALLIIAPGVLVFCLLMTLAFRRRHAAAVVTSTPATGQPTTTRSVVETSTASTATATATRTEPGRLARFGLFWYDFVIGDDWQIAAGVAIALIITGLAAGWTAAWLIPVVVVAFLIPYGTARAARS
ncbi:COG4280 domain-containing protein [Microlunatus sp. Gsoil 973]|uniref:COG4280 domain-containing protein n=1 Tax=Microlunatus sp. Gsoil 973 TaxID=2672569 RepID=UPI0018A7EE6E|nr:hypothetical protein [Microlunatus sp. Gsoil 973]